MQKKLLKIKSIFDVQNKFRIWVDIERAVIKFLFQNKYFTEEQFQRLVDGLKVDAFEVVGESGEHNFESFVDVLASRSYCFKKDLILGALPYLNVLDITNSLIIRDVNEILLQELKEIKAKLKDLAFKYKDLFQIGRTHGVHAEPTVFGYKFAVCYCDIEREIAELIEVRKDLEVACVDYSAFHDPLVSVEFQDFLAQELELYSANSSLEYLSKERYMFYFSLLNSIAQTVNKLVLDLKILSCPSISEVAFSFLEEQYLLDILGEVNLLKGYLHAISGMDLNWDEKSSLFISQNGILNKASCSIYCLLAKFNYILERLNVNEEKVKSNIDLTRGNIFSQSVMSFLIEKTSFPRTQILREIKSLTAKVLSTSFLTFQEVLLESTYGKYFSKEELSLLFSFEKYGRNMDLIYSRIFNNPSSDENRSRAIDKLAFQINREYLREEDGVVFINLSNKGISVVGDLLPQLNFGVFLISLNLDEESLDLSEVKKKQLEGRRVIVFDYSLDSNVYSFLDQLQESVTVKDIKLCSFLKSNTDVDWFGMNLSSGYSHNTKTTV